MIASTMITAGRLMSAPGAATGRRAHPGRQLDAEPGEDPLEVAAPADRDGHRSDRVLEDQVPADHPGEDLAERGVGVGVGAAGDRDHRRELGVAERREPAREARRSRTTARWPGPAWLAAAVPVSTKMPVPMIAPMPSSVRSIAVSVRFSALPPCSDVADQLLDRLRLQQIRIHSPSARAVHRPRIAWLRKSRH